MWVAGWSPERAEGFRGLDATSSRSLPPPHGSIRPVRFFVAHRPTRGGVIRDVTGSYSIAFGGLVVPGVILLVLSMLFDPNWDTVAASPTAQVASENT